MRIEIKVEGNDKPTSIVFSNDNSNNYNYVDLLTDDNCFTVAVTDLEAIAKAFSVERKNFQE